MEVQEDEVGVQVTKKKPSSIRGASSLSSSRSSSLVVPGQVITTEQGYLRGHGTFFETGGQGGEGEGEDRLVSSLAGVIERVNKLVSVRPPSSRYLGEVGDLIVGRITAVESKRWKCDVSGQKDAVLQLASVNLPGGVQRMRTYEDQLQMRSLFQEHDLISAEIQNVGSDGTLSLHTRSLKYGKLQNGQLIVVPSSLIKRLNQHYISLPWGIDLILGRNGFIWISRCIPEEWKAQEEDPDDVTPLAETWMRLKARHAETPMLLDDVSKIARVRNSIDVLSRVQAQIYPATIIKLYRRSETLQMPIKDMLLPSNIMLLTEDLQSQ